jgi:hypothetical protein
MVFVSGRETTERRIVSHDYAAHVLRNRPLPRIVFAQTSSGASLKAGNLLGMGAMDTLPSISREVGVHELRLGCAFEHFRHRYWTDPESSCAISLEPGQCRTLDVVGELVQQVDNE